MGPDVALITIMRSQNETGALLPVADVAAQPHRARAVVHTDAAQAIGKIHVDVTDLDVDLLPIASAVQIGATCVEMEAAAPYA